MRTKYSLALVFAFWLTHEKLLENIFQEFLTSVLKIQVIDLMSGCLLKDVVFNR
jgi:hypothetical protein